MNNEDALFLFNRDLRIEDNVCLYLAVRNSRNVYPIFILTPKQINPRENSYYNEKFVDFMCRTLYLLGKQIPLTIFMGETKEVIQKILSSNTNIKKLYNNLDVTPFAKNRTEQLAELCSKHKVEFVQGSDVFLGRENILQYPGLNKKDGSVYLKFTPFYNNAFPQVAKKNSVCPKIQDISKFKMLGKTQNLNILEKFFIKENDLCPFKPGRKAAEETIKKYVLTKVDYSKTRDLPYMNSTSHISAYLKLGILGPVEVMKAFEKTRNGKDIIRQLFWREFYLYIIFYSHTDYSKKSKTLQKMNNKINWKNSKEDFKKWCTGNTGIPWVDAGMRELNNTGYMQNRLRMNVAMFLIFYLKIDWTWGEKYFAQKLVDYDYCNNLGGWLWSSSWEVHSNESYRVFSMIEQMKKYDAEAKYVKKWIPELGSVEPSDLYDWCKNRNKYSNLKYPEPVIKNLERKKYPF